MRIFRKAGSGRVHRDTGIQSSVHRLTRSALVVATAFGLVGSAAAMTGAASASTGVRAHKTAVVKPDFAFYRGKTLSFITGGGSGAGYDEFALTLAPAIGSYLHATVNVTDITPGATIPGSDEGASAAPNGLTIAMGYFGEYIQNDIEKVPSVAYTIKDQELIGGAGPQPYVLAAVKSSGLTRLGTALKTKNVWVSLEGQGGMMTTFLLDAYKSHGSTILSGYPNAPGALAGLLRRDGTIGINAASVFIPSIQAGTLVPLASSVPATPGTVDYARMSHVPTLSTWMAANPPKVKSAFAAMKVMNALDAMAFDTLFEPQGTPMKYVAALRIAFKHAMLSKSVDSALLNLDIPDTYVTPQEITRQINAATLPSGEAAIKPYLTLNANG
ncbi:MAG TPA: hypothetical protein VMU99_10060 [Acidimicrobiales bacterium]|nr:hypothetical protein [Acidimicrobiales bacterium]